MVKEERLSEEEVKALYKLVPKVGVWKTSRAMHAIRKIRFDATEIPQWQTKFLKLGCVVNGVYINPGEQCLPEGLHRAIEDMTSRTFKNVDNLTQGSRYMPVEYAAHIVL